MKKTLSCIIICALLLVGCGSKTMKGTELFEFDLKMVDKIEFYLPDESVVVIDDEEKIKEFCTTLGEREYVQREENDLVGFYFVKLSLGSEIIEIGFGVTSIAYNGNQYDVADAEGLYHLLEIIDIEY